MKVKTAMGVAAAGVLLGVGMLAGTVIGTNHASAQTPSATATALPGNENTKPSDPGAGRPFGGKHDRGGNFGPGMGMGMGGHGGGHDGFGPGMDGRGPATADSATREISRTTSIITQVKADLAYAKGKMDTADVERWISGADTLLQSAQSAQAASNFAQAGTYANSAAQLVEVAERQMAQKLGADKLPSYSQRPERPGRPGDNATPATVTQAQASRVLQNTYNRLVEQGAAIKSASNAGPAATYLTDAQNSYKAAYAAYGAGNYSDAVAAARQAEELAHVAESVLRAASAPSDPNAPVTVPAPNFQ